MKKLINKFKADLLTNSIIFGGGLLLGVIFFFLYIYVFNDEQSLNIMSDGAFILGAFFLGIGGLLAIIHIGFFDALGYGFSMMGNIFFRPTKLERKYQDLIDYKEQKYVKRKDHGFYYLSFLILGMIFLLFALIFYFIFFISNG